MVEIVISLHFDTEFPIRTKYSMRRFSCCFLQLWGLADKNFRTSRGLVNILITKLDNGKGSDVCFATNLAYDHIESKNSQQKSKLCEKFNTFLPRLSANWDRTIIDMEIFIIFKIFDCKWRRYCTNRNQNDSSAVSVHLHKRSLVVNFNEKVTMPSNRVK